MQRGTGKFGLFLFLILGIASSFVSAVPDYTCPVSQQLFRISSQTNAHAEAFNGGGNYLVHICYDDYFGTYTGARDSVCTPGNPAFLRLSGLSDAHAEDPSLATPGYTTDLCFSNSFSCTYQSASVACAAGRVEVASFSDRTNAHAGIPGSYAGPQNYRLCCGIGPATPQCSDGIDNDGDTLIDFPADPGCSSAQDTDETNDILFTNFTQLYWKNNAGTPIGQPFMSNSSVNWTVRTTAHTGFPVNTNLTFEIWEKDALVDDSIRNFTVLTSAGSPASVGEIINYRISDSDIEAGRSQFLDEDRNAQFEQFYFKVHTTDGSISSEVNISYILDVSVTAASNNPPVANITAPVHRGVYYAGTTVEFRQSSYDRDGGSLTYLWTIAEDSFTSTNAIFNYTFSTPGQKTITLRVTDEFGSWDEDQVGIMVLASPGIFGFINQPSHQELLVNRSLIVRVNANDSYVLNSEGSCPGITVTCLAGVCPSQTQNAPAGCSPTLSILNTPQGFDRLYFDWGFSDGDSAPAADGLGAVSISKRFGQASSTISDYKRADLNINYTDSAAPGGTISLLRSTNRFFTLLDARQCINDGTTWVEYNYTTGQITHSWSTFETTNRCSGYNGIAGDGDDCCPARHTCSGTPAACIPVNESRCSDYQSRNSCEDDSSHVVETDPNWDDECDSGRASNGTIVSCSCDWESSGDDSACVFSKEYRQGTTIGNPSTCDPYKCTYLPTSAPTECVNGYATVTVQAQFVPGTCTIPAGAEAACLAGTGQRTVLCGRPSVSLDFFGPWQFISTLLVVLFIYCVWWIDKRR